MMKGIVQSVRAERTDGEAAAVGACSGSVPLCRLDGIKALGVLRRQVQELAIDDGGILEVVTLLQGRFILIPVLKHGTVFFEHSTEPLVEDSIDVADVTGVLEGGPTILAGSKSDVVALEDVRPLRSVHANRLTERRGRVVLGVEAALSTRSFEDPGPIFGVRGN